MKLATAFLLFTAWAAAVTVCDCRARRIPNSLVIAGLIAALTCALVLQAPFGVSVMQAMIGMGIGLVALMPFFALNMMGAADVKVFAVLGAWFGMHALLGLWMVASVAAGLHAVWLLVRSRTPLVALIRNSAPTFAMAGKRATPYAACLCIPAVIALTVRIFAEHIQ
ncbi:A24 family peptidase [Paraburkholderia sp.]|uniref:A24 family peptidase n=1 Tax=Paraburkholderia sp. TaxID=1926495 RepID=UPI002AFDDCE3|nr:prepilin peptidase [Paraburkholderia sp.]